eukprot:CFRG6067T1
MSTTCPLVSSVHVNKAHCEYTACYCEENIWCLSKYLLDQRDATDHAKPENCCRDAQLTVCFISNHARRVPVWYQKRTNDLNVPMIWDYHVILFVECPHNPRGLVYDFDTILPFPCDAAEYIWKAFAVTIPRNPIYYGFYRLISGEKYVDLFGSDRSHMLIADGGYSATPPSYPCINPDVNNLNEFIQMDKPVGDGSTVRSSESTLLSSASHLPTPINILELAKRFAPCITEMVADGDYSLSTPAHVLYVDRDDDE